MNVLHNIEQRETVENVEKNANVIYERFLDAHFEFNKHVSIKYT